MRYQGGIEVTAEMRHEIQERREVLGVSFNRLATVANCSPNAIQRIEDGVSYQSTLIPQIMNALTQLETDRDKQKQTAVESKGKCSVCGVLLFDNVESIPSGWIVVWHLDCGDVCPEHAISSGRGNQKLAKRHLAEYPDYFSKEKAGHDQHVMA